MFCEFLDTFLCYSQPIIANIKSNKVKTILSSADFGFINSNFKIKFFKYTENLFNLNYSKKMTG